MTLTKSGRTLAFALAALPALALSAQHALAAGYAVREQSGSALGNAFAGAPTGIDDPSYMFWNPAMLTYLDGIQAAASGSYIIPNAEFKDGSATTAIGASSATARLSSRGHSPTESSAAAFAGSRAKRALSASKSASSTPSSSGLGRRLVARRNP